MFLDEEISQAIILDHYRKPRHCGCCEDATADGETTNPACGDEISVSARVGEFGKVECLLFEGQGCAVSQAGASLVMDLLQGMRREEAVEVLRKFLRLMRGDDGGDGWEEMGSLGAMGVMRKVPARVVCATLAAELVLEVLG